MKKYIFLFFLTLAVIFPVGIFAQVDTKDEEVETTQTQVEEKESPDEETSDDEDTKDDEESEPTPEEERKDETEKKTDENVEQIKEQVASTVDELAKESKYATAGFITDIEEDKIYVNSMKGEVEVLIDQDLTTVFEIDGSDTEELELDDLEKNNYVSIVGPRIDGTTNANTIYVDSHYVVRSGKITEVNDDDFYITIITPEKDSLTLDVEKKTTQQIIDVKTLALQDAGFSKLKEGDTVHFAAQRGPQEDQTRFSVATILIIPQEYFLK